MFIYFVKIIIFSNVRIRISRNFCSEVFEILLIFLIRYNQVNMRNREEISNHWNVRFANFAYFICNFTKSNDFRNHFVEKFKSFDWNIQNSIKIDEEWIKSMLFCFDVHHFQEKLFYLSNRCFFSQRALFRIFFVSWSITS